MAGPLVRAATRLVGIDPRTFNNVAQAGHACGGALAVLAPATLIGPGWRWWGALALLVFASGKEFWWDRRYESAEVAGSGIEDWAFYQVGALAALVAYQFWGVTICP